MAIRKGEQNKAAGHKNATSGTRKGRKKQADPPSFEKEQERKRQAAKRKEKNTKPVAASTAEESDAEKSDVASEVEVVEEEVLAEAELPRKRKQVDTLESAALKRKKMVHDKKAAETEEEETLSEIELMNGEEEEADSDAEEEEAMLEMALDKETESAIAAQVAKIPFNADSSARGVVYLGRIPHGFYEKQMKAYFSQFGEVTRLRLSRNRKTGASRHYAFLEFKHPNVAQIVADTMHNYLMFGRLLQCQVIPSEKVHDDLFKNSAQIMKHRTTRAKYINKHNKPKTEEHCQKKIQAMKKKEKKRNAELKEQGIDYAFTGVSDLITA